MPPSPPLCPDSGNVSLGGRPAIQLLDDWDPLPSDLFSGLLDPEPEPVEVNLWKPAPTAAEETVRIRFLHRIHHWREFWQDTSEWILFPEAHDEVFGWKQDECRYCWGELTS